MRFLSRSWLGVVACISLLTAAPFQHCLAQQWQNLGRLPNSLDTVYIDTGSVEQEDGFRIVLIKTVSPEPRANKNNITMDSRIQQTAFDCEKRTFYGIRTYGYLNGKQVGSGPPATDWKTKLIPVSEDALSQQIVSTVCGLPVTSSKNVSTQPAPAQASASPARSPNPHLEGENLLFSPPKDFKLAYHSDRVGSMSEFVPNGQTVEDWTEMITVQIFHELNVDPAIFLQSIGKNFVKACPGFTSPKGIATGQVNGYVVSVLVVNCPNNPATSKPETTIFRVIKGRDALYSVQHAWRSVASDKDLADAMLALRSVAVCDTRDSAHPCPSFDSVASAAQPKPKSSSGSGIVVNLDGYILTDAHVVRNCKSIAVKPKNADAVPAKLAAIDPKNDLALIKTSAGYGQPLQFRAQSDPVKLGETVGVIGYPLAGVLSTEPKATFGQVNSLAGAGNDYTRLQISAPVQAGSSGGPVLDTSGNVIAIVASSLNTVLQTGSVPQNVNFAIRGELAQILMKAQGISFIVGDHKEELRTEEIANKGQKATALVICSNE